MKDDKSTSKQTIPRTLEMERRMCVDVGLVSSVLEGVPAELFTCGEEIGLCEV